MRIGSTVHGPKSFGVAVCTTHTHTHTSAGILYLSGSTSDNYSVLQICHRKCTVWTLGFDCRFGVRDSGVQILISWVLISVVTWLMTNVAKELLRSGILTWFFSKMMRQI